MLELDKQLGGRKQESSCHTTGDTLRILAFFWHPKIGVTVGAYKRFIDILGHLEDYDIKYDIIESKPTILRTSGRHEVYEYEIPFNYSTYFSKFFTLLYTMLMMTFLGIKTCHKKRYDLLIAPTGEISSTIIPVYVTHLVTRIPWTAFVCNVPEAYAVVDSRGQLIMSFTKIYEYYRNRKFGVFNAFLMTCYSFFPKLLLPKIYSKAKAILSFNKSLSFYLRSLGTRCKIFPVGTGLNFDEIPKSNTPCVKRYSAMFLGRFVPEKGIFDALEVWRKVTEILPQASLVLVGYADQTQMSAVKNMISELDISENVKILGTVIGEEKYNLLKSTSLLLFLSRFESFGYVIAEAMACGLPVVGYDAPYVRELFSCPAVLRAPIGDIDGAAALVCDLLKDEEKRQRLGKQAQEYVKRFEWSEVAKKEAQIYRTVLNLNRLSS